MKNLPKFKDQNEEIAFWDKNDVTDFFDYQKRKNCTLFKSQKKHKNHIVTAT